MTHDLQFSDVQFRLIGDAALFWPEHDILLVADLHLEKAIFYAKRGQMLPPYDSHATLTELASLAQACRAKQIICLGDNFHDDEGEARLPADAAQLLRDLISCYDWTWITGNHDAGLAGIWGGHCYEEKRIGNIMLRHEADPEYTGLEISGHYHPKIRINVGRRHVTRRCFTMSAHKIIMPAFGVLTGGMDAARAALLAQPSLRESGDAQAIIGLPDKAAKFALDVLNRRKI